MNETEPSPDDDRNLVVDHRLSVPRSEFAFEFARSGGPGGQNVNKVNSKATLRWRPAESPSLSPLLKSRVLRLAANRLNAEGELVITSQKTRDQGRNIDDCLEKLKLLLLDALNPPAPRRPSRPTLGSQRRRVEDKQRRGATKKLRQKPDLD